MLVHTLHPALEDRKIALNRVGRNDGVGSAVIVGERFAKVGIL
jgi:hypothetical protein